MDVGTLIVGAGSSGIGAAIALDRAGLGDFLMVEAGGGVAGTWFWNGVLHSRRLPLSDYRFSA